MSLKHLLGLDKTDMTDEEIAQILLRAQRKHLESVQFPVAKKKVKVRLHDVEPKGIMRGNESYYGENT